MDYGMNLRRARKWAKITQKDLAAKAGIATITLQQYESGKRKPSAENWWALADALHLSIDELNDAAQLPLGLFDPATIMEETELDAAKGRREIKHELLLSFSQLNDVGQTEAVKRVSELTEIPRYRRSDAQDAAKGTDADLPAEAPINGSESPAEGKK